METKPESSTPPVPSVLTATQLHALFDILTHHETYAEVESFKYPGTISEYGFPFAQRTAQSTSGPIYSTISSAPLLAGVLQSIVLTIPGVRDLPAEFWHVRLQGILEKFAEAELSESYDKGALGTRKTLATAASAIHEAVSRGVLGGVEHGQQRNLQRQYDRSDAESLAQAWEDVVHEVLYGNLIDELFGCAAEHENLEVHSPAIQATVDYIIIHLATLLHRVFILNPDGPYLLKLLENVHKLLPYAMVKQALRIGNAATMINGMMRLLLAKVGVGAISNWIGLTQNANDGMNLLQRILWLVLSWDSLEFRKVVESTEKTRGGTGLSKDVLSAIKDYLNKPRQEHDNARSASLESSTDMVSVILERSDPDRPATLTQEQHAQCHEYFSALLAARDRDEIAKVLCRQNPDLFTQAIKDGVAGFEPIIRAIHEGVDLVEHVSAAEGFLVEFIKVSKGRRPAKSRLDSRPSGISRGDSTEIRSPSVEDYVVLLRRNRQLVYNWLHQVASQCPDIREEFRAWAKETIKVFQRKNQASPGPVAVQPPEAGHIRPPQRKGAAGALSSNLQHLYASLPADTRSRILPTIDAHAKYLTTLDRLSLARMQRILDNLNSNDNNTIADNSITVPNPSFAAAAAPTTPTSSSTNPTSPSTTNSPFPLSTSWWSSLSNHYHGPISRSANSARAPPKSAITGTAATTTPPPPPSSTINETSSMPSPSFSGPGMYLSRWQHLLDETLIAPAPSPRAHGSGSGPGGCPSSTIRKGRDVRGLVAPGKWKAVGANASVWDGGVLVAVGKEGEEHEPAPPDVSGVVEALGRGFRELVAGLLREGVPRGARVGGAGTEG